MGNMLDASVRVDNDNRNGDHHGPCIVGYVDVYLCRLRQRRRSKTAEDEKKCDSMEYVNSTTVFIVHEQYLAILFWAIDVL
jgi:hypothetical protein